jgi:hypothetical protein
MRGRGWAPCGRTRVTEELNVQGRAGHKDMGRSRAVSPTCGPRRQAIDLGINTQLQGNELGRYAVVYGDAPVLLERPDIDPAGPASPRAPHQRSADAPSRRNALHWGSPAKCDSACHSASQWP